MKTPIAILLFLLATAAQAQVLIQAPSASPAEFKKYLQENPSARSYSDVQTEKLQQAPQQEQQLFQLADLSPSEIPQGLETLNRLNQQSALSSLSLQFLQDLTSKWQSGKLSPQAQSSVRNLHCKFSLLQDESSLTICAVETVSLENLRKLNPWMKALAVESQPIPLEESSRLKIVTEAPYHFTLISDSHASISFYGTFAQLLQQTNHPQALVEGGCGGFQSQIDDINLSLQARVFFTASCVQATNQADEETEKSWVQRNKKWLIPTAAILVGGGIYALKDKKVIIDKPSFK
ncbi:hypothetical protein [Bdellovibrio bacteriovorus]|uniref:Uncharacterized protein n=1 Tax=Bdellovibrio bacteriovorus str. Tiberius TaxID=1069642 RepID=K7YSP4_BDEBC|nr:hypothetical protein [Bdellovibrio bacteriovorus]AFY02901.1 hypothetical protein Bdt_3226 [Bdellovibrio bacteriovorus str. Tiberius]